MHEHGGFGQLVHVLNPGCFGVGLCLEQFNARAVHMADDVGDHLDVLLDGYWHVGEHRWRSRTSNHEHIGKSNTGKPEVGQRPGFPLVLEFLAGATANVDLVKRPGHGVEPRGVHDDVEVVLLFTSQDAGLGDFVDRFDVDVDQADVVAVKRVEVVGVDKHSF